jgi:hypothetical protein
MVVDRQVWSGTREGSWRLGRQLRLSAQRFLAAVGGEGRRNRTAVIAAAVGLSLVLVSTADAAVSFSRKDYPLPEGTWSGGSPGNGTAPRSDVLTSAALVDLNGDGKLDIAIANGYTGKVVVLLNQGHGTFAPAPGSPFFACESSSIVSDIVAGQLNPKVDHHADVAVTCEVEGGVWRLLGNGAGGLGTPQAISPNSAVGPLLLGHLSADAYGDLVYMNVSSPYEWPCLAPLDGFGGVGTANCFQEDYTHAAAPLILWHFHPNACSGGDEMLGFGYDTGDTDWAFQDAEYNGAYTQGPSTDPPSGPCGSPFHTSGYGHDSGIAFSSARPSGIAAGDLNGDGTPDVVMADSGGAVHVALSHGGGFPTGDTPSKFTSAGPITSIRLADFNGDHHLDIAAGESDPTGVHSNWVAIHLGKTTTFAAAQKFAVAGIQTNIDELPKIAVGDLNGDGKPDIVSVAGHAGVVTVLLNTTPTPAQMKALLLTELPPTGAAAKIGALLKNGGYSFSPRALTAGHLVFSWYRKNGTPSPLLVATGAVSFSRSGRMGVKITLTSKGKQLLKNSQQLALTGKGTFTPGGEPPVVAFKKFTLRR